MSDRGFESVIERIIREGSARIDAHDRQLIDFIVREYQAAREALRQEIAILEQQILWSIEHADGEITDAWIRRQTWFRTLEESIEREVARLEGRQRILVDNVHRVGAAEAVSTTRAITQTAPWLRQVNVPALERWVASITQGSPLDRVLTNYGATAKDVLIREITQGIIRGRGSSNVTRSVMSALEDQMEEYRASRIVRQEMLRTYRGVWRDQMDSLVPEKAISGYRRIAKLDSRTCPTCVALHNSITEDYPDDFHIMDRCVVVPVFSTDYVPAPDEPYQRGDEWLREQPEEMQVAILGNGERYSRWKDGHNLRDQIEYVPDPVWGGTSKLIPLNRLPKRKAA